MEDTLLGKCCFLTSDMGWVLIRVILRWKADGERGILLYLKLGKEDEEQQRKRERS